MSADFRKLKSFVKIVDAGSVSRAASLLRIAQPALSQQIVALETYFKTKLLIRSNHGIAPTEAGMVLYRHAQLLLKQMEQAKTEVATSTRSVVGHVSIGLATYSNSASLALPFLQEMNHLHPEIMVHINDSFGQVLSELIMSGRMDIAVIYGSGAIKGVEMTQLFREELCLVIHPDMAQPFQGSEILSLAQLAGMKMLLPSKGHFLRRLIDDSFARAQVTPHVFAEIESTATLAAAVKEGLGATILPHSIASTTAQNSGALIFRLKRPTIEAGVYLCISDHMPLSEPAVAARAVLLNVVDRLSRMRNAGHA